jgi:tetratricopeptide (TPR) repeat protein
MIARNEAQMLAGCLESVRNVVDEIVLVDTGSTDDTKAIAKKYGAKIFDLPWQEDFATPRNEALRHATGHFVLILDADERLAPGAQKQLRQALRDKEFDCGMLRLHNATRMDAPAAEVVAGKSRIGEPFYLPRLLRRTPDLQYRGIVHEAVTDWVARRGNKLQYFNVDIVHLGGVPEFRAARNKSERNIGLLKKRCQLEPDDLTASGYLAFELRSIGKSDEAWEVVEAGWKLLPTNPPHRTALRLAAARGQLQLERGDAAGVFQTLKAARPFDRGHPDLDFLSGCAFETLALKAAGNRKLQKRYARTAARRYRACIEKLDARLVQCFTLGSSAHGAYTRYGTALLMLGEFAAAQKSFTHALAALPDSMEAKLGRAEATLEHEGPQQALKELEPMLNTHPDGWLLAAAAAERLSALPDFEMLFRSAYQRIPAGFVAPHRRERFWDLAFAVGAYAGRPAPEAGPLGTVGAVMAKQAVFEPAAFDAVDTQLLSRVLSHLMKNSRNDLLEPLLQENADRAVPGIRAFVQSLLARAA